MTKDDAIKMIDAHKNLLVNPIDMLHWTWLRVIILQIPDDQWNIYVEDAMGILTTGG